jgi:hypothetical protein
MAGAPMSNVQKSAVDIKILADTASMKKSMK